MNELARRLGIAFPLIQAGMGGIAGARLAAAVASAGGGGVLGLYRMPETAIADVVRRTRELTSRPFGVNLIPELMDAEGLARQAQAVLASADESVFFTFYGLPHAAVAAGLRRALRRFLVMVGSVEQATAARELGATAVIVQGTEAGGHLLGKDRLDDLICEVASSGCDIPILASGGISTGSDFRRLHSLGAVGCVCGTLFVATVESDAHPLYKQRLVESAADDTLVTDVFDIGWANRRHRVLGNALTNRIGDKLPTTFIAEARVLGARHPIPRYSAMVPTRYTRGRIDEMAMYCGTSVDGVRDIVPAATVVERFVAAFSGQQDPPHS